MGKRSLGTASDKGKLRVERILSLKETCRLRAMSNYINLSRCAQAILPSPTARSRWL
jgi:hypothetical protein